MTEEVQNYVWQNCLPKEFKEGVKYYYQHTDSGSYAEDMLESIFGKHNLTSDAEGEEMLTVSAITVREMYAANDRLIAEFIGSEIAKDAAIINNMLRRLFGSKCLPDETSKLQASCRQVNVDSLEPKPAGPKLKRCDKVIAPSGEVRIIEDTHFENGSWLYLVGDPAQWIPESDLEPYTEPEEEFPKMKPIESKVSVYLATKEEDEEFRLLLHENGFRWSSGDPLINNACWNSYTEKSKIHYFYPDKTVTYWGDKTSETRTFSEFKKQFFEEEPRELSQKPQNCDYTVPDRLHIAAMAMLGILSNTDRLRENVVIGSRVSFESFVARDALRYADALIAESHK